jgi:hypothetical protein
VRDRKDIKEALNKASRRFFGIGGGTGTAGEEKWGMSRRAGARRKFLRHGGGPFARPRGLTPRAGGRRELRRRRLPGAQRRKIAACRAPHAPQPPRPAITPPAAPAFSSNPKIPPRALFSASLANASPRVGALPRRKPRQLRSNLHCPRRCLS